MANEPDDGLTGAAFELANAGYTPMSDPDKEREDEAIGSDVASLREAAERLNDAPREATIRAYIGPDGNPVAPTEAITLERAARDYAAATSAERLLAENQSSEALAARVDALRERLRREASKPQRPRFDIVLGLFYELAVVVLCGYYHAARKARASSTCGARVEDRSWSSGRA